MNYCSCSHGAKCFLPGAMTEFFLYMNETIFRKYVDRLELPYFWEIREDLTGILKQTLSLTLFIQQSTFIKVVGGKIALGTIFEFSVTNLC